MIHNECNYRPYIEKPIHIKTCLKPHYCSSLKNNTKANIKTRVNIMKKGHRNIS